MRLMQNKLVTCLLFVVSLSVTNELSLLCVMMLYVCLFDSKCFVCMDGIVFVTMFACLK